MNLALDVDGPLSELPISGSVGIASPIRAQVKTPPHRCPAGRPEAEPRTNHDRWAERGHWKRIFDDRRPSRLPGGRGREQPKLDPNRLNLRVGGSLNLAVLPALVPATVTEASGTARISGVLRGTAATPEVVARVDLRPSRVQLRDPARELWLESGELRIADNLIELRSVKAKIDGEGEIRIGSEDVKPGRLQLTQTGATWTWQRMSLPIRGSGIPYRVSDTLALSDIGFDLDLKGDRENGLALGGNINIAAGRYTQDFQIRDYVSVSPAVNETPVGRSTFDRQPSVLDRTRLDLRVRTVGDSFLVQNNLVPEMYMVVDLRITGTSGSPKIAGDVRPTDGRFRVFGIRGEFDLVPNANFITFVSSKSIDAGETPELNLEATNLVVDSAGIDRNVRMRVLGPIGQAQIDLSTDDGLDRNQTLLLLLSGRTSKTL